MSQEKDFAWLAGIVDGEGSVTMAVSRSKKLQWYVPHLSVVNTDPSIISEVVRILNSVNCRFHMSDRRLRGHIGKKVVWQIVIHHFESLRTILSLIQTDLRSEKGPRAGLMIRWLESRIPKIQKGNNQSRAYTEEENSIVTKLRVVGSGR